MAWLAGPGLELGLGSSRNLNLTRTRKCQEGTRARLTWSPAVSTAPAGAVDGCRTTCYAVTVWVLHVGNRYTGSSPHYRYTGSSPHYRYTGSTPPYRGTMGLLASLPWHYGPPGLPTLALELNRP